MRKTDQAGKRRRKRKAGISTERISERDQLRGFWHEYIGQFKFPVHLGCAHNCKLIIFKIVWKDLFTFAG